MCNEGTGGTSHLHSRRTWRRAITRLAILSVFPASMAGCGSQDTLSLGELVAAVDAGAASIHVRTDGGYLVGSAGELVELGADGLETARHRIDGSGPPTAFGGFDRDLFLRTRSSLLKIGAVSGDSLVERAELGVDAVALDPRQRVILRTEGAGTVVAHDPATLEPIWGWSAIGGSSYALAISPEGDRAYQSLLDEDGAATLLVRDMLTGRVLRTAELPEPPRTIAVDAGGDLLLVGWHERGGGAITRMNWRGGELRISWRKPLSDFGLSPPIRLIASPDTRLVLLATINEEAGLRVIDTETGRELERFRDSVADATFGFGNRIYLLRGGEIRVAE